MHPIERLRYVARASGVPGGVLARETAGALAGFTSEPAGLLTACRQILARQPGSGPLVWLTARVITSPDPRRETWDAVEAIENDTTPTELEYALPDGATVAVLGWPDLTAGALRRRADLEVFVVDAMGEGSRLVTQLVERDVEAIDVPLSGLGVAVADAELLVLEASAVGPTSALAIAGSRAAAAVAKSAGVPVWLVAGTGTVLPQRMWDGLWRPFAEGDDPWEYDLVEVPLDLIDQVVGPKGLVSVASALQSGTCPSAPELFEWGV